MTMRIGRSLYWPSPACCALLLALTAGSPAASGMHATDFKTHVRIAKDISGIVRDKSGAALPGVTVAIEGTSKGTTTDPEGKFTLTGVPDNATLVFSFIGYQAQKVPVAGTTSWNIVLQDNATELDQLVVVGYGTRKKSDLTGAVTQLQLGKLENENPSAVQDALRGNIPGLSVTGNNSAKGGGDLQIRGRSSLNANSSPLLVLDGVIYPGALSDINPNDIQTIDVLKDASAAAVFGAKSASGVVLITTKKGSSGKPTVTLNSNIGVATLAMDQPLYDGAGFVRWRTDVLKSMNANAKPYQFDDPRQLPSDITIDQWKAYDNSQGDPVDIWLNRLKILSLEVKNYKAGQETDWYSQMFQKGLRNDHTVSVSGKNESVSYYISAGYTNNEGVILGDKFTTFRTRINVEAKAAKWATVGINLQFADRDESQVTVDWGQMINASPWGQKYKDDGITLRDSPNDDIGNNTNPFLNYAYTDRLQKFHTLFGSIYAKGEIGYGFSYQVNFTPNFEWGKYFNANLAKDFRYAARKGYAVRRQQDFFNWQIDNILRWNKTYGDHDFDVTLLYNSEKYQSWRNQMENEGFDPNDNLSWHNIGSGIKPVISSFDSLATGDALMGRLNYSWKQKYMLTASIRRDGYSAFGQSNPRANFPSVGVGWVFSKESFVNLPWLSFGKLRASWGVVGNRDIGRYVALGNLTTGKYQYIMPNGNIVLVSQLYGSRMPNPQLKWEKSISYNLGLDFSVLNDRLSGTIEVYRKSTTDLLTSRSLSDVTGYDNVISNLGEIQNRGLELSLNSVNMRTTDFEWGSSLNFFTNRNRIVSLYGPVPVKGADGKIVMKELDDRGNRWFIGHDIDEIWDMKVLGVWKTSEAAEAAKFGVKPGDFKLQDTNGDGKFSDDDKQFLGYRSPRYQWTLRNDFSYKGLSLSFMLYSHWGHYKDYNQAKNNSGFIDRQNSYIIPYWTPENQIDDHARLFSNNGSIGFTNFRKASFIRLNTVALAYAVPQAISKRIGIGSLKVYGNISNAAIWQPDWMFWDAEYGNNIPARNYSLGINATF